MADPRTAPTPPAASYCDACGAPARRLDTGVRVPCACGQGRRWAPSAAGFWRTTLDAPCVEERTATLGTALLVVRRTRHLPEHPWSRWVAVVYARPWRSEDVRTYARERGAKVAAVAFANQLARGRRG